MAIPLKQSTASQEIILGYFVDSTDGNTEETALTIANTDIKLWKAGATTLANKNSGGATHISNGLYYAVLDATDTNTLGPLVVFVHVAGALAVRVECVVHPAQVFDSLFGADTLQVDVAQWNNANIATPDTAGYPKVTHKTGTGTGEVSITSGVVSANAVQVSGDATAADNWEAMMDGTRAKLWLTGLDIAAASNDPAIKALGSGTGDGMYIMGGASGNGATFTGLGSGDGLFATGHSGLRVEGDTEAGLYARGSGIDAMGMKLEAGSGDGEGLVVDNATLAAVVLNAATADYDTAGTIGAAIGSGGGGGGGTDVTAIDGSSVAADNLRKMFDGTGYLATTSQIGGVVGTVNANVVTVFSNGTAASRLNATMQGVVAGAAVAGTLSTTEMTTNLTETTNNHWKAPHVVKWISGTLAGQARAVTGYVGATKKLQYVATTEAPAAGDQFIIL